MRRCRSRSGRFTRLPDRRRRRYLGFRDRLVRGAVYIEVSNLLLVEDKERDLHRKSILDLSKRSLAKGLSRARAAGVAPALGAHP